MPALTSLLSYLVGHLSGSSSNASWERINRPRKIYIFCHFEYQRGFFILEFANFSLKPGNSMPGMNSSYLQNPNECRLHNQWGSSSTGGSAKSAFLCQHGPPCGSVVPQGGKNVDRNGVWLTSAYVLYFVSHLLSILL